MPLSVLTLACCTVLNPQDETPPLDPRVAEPASPLIAMKTGTFNVQLRGRAEWTDVGRFDRSAAYTNRFRLGYTTAPWHGFTAKAEFEDIRAFKDELYNDTVNGPFDHSPVPDPVDTELNQAWLRYEAAPLRSRVTAGRQRITMTDLRWVGHAPWRQNERTYDAFHFQGQTPEDGNDGVARWTYAYLRDINQVLGPAANRDFRSDSHAADVSWALPNGIAELHAFVYSLRFSNAPNLSSDTYGLRIHGTTALDDDLTLDYDASYAMQQDGRSNPISYDAHYQALELGLQHQDIVRLAIGHETLGSDGGTIGLSTPLGNVHKHNGWADGFNQTPARGLEELYTSLDVWTPWETHVFIRGHWFSEEYGGGDSLGRELDVAVTHPLGDATTAQLGGAWLDGAGGTPDIRRIWMMLTLRF